MKKWSEINKRYDEYKISLFYNNLEDTSDYFELANIKSQRLLHEYLNIDTNMSYIDWLQEQVLTLRILK